LTHTPWPTRLEDEAAGAAVVVAALGCFCRWRCAVCTAWPTRFGEEAARAAVVAALGWSDGGESGGVGEGSGRSSLCLQPWWQQQLRQRRQMVAGEGGVLRAGWDQQPELAWCYLEAASQAGGEGSELIERGSDSTPKARLALARSTRARSGKG
ncbi:hypothetical protein CLOM_g8911, partial [Closterium sp. NIES-68]